MKVKWSWLCKRHKGKYGEWKYSSTYA